MAGRMYLGPRTGSAMTLRFMKNPADDPATTARTAYDKFAFDSETGDLAYAYGVGSSVAVSGMAYRPMISTMARFEASWWDIQSARRHAPSGRTLALTDHWGEVSSIDSYSSQAPSIHVGKASGTDADPGWTALETKMLIWQLPATNTSVPFPSSTAGQSRIYISDTAIRVPRSGYAYNDSDPNHFILHENMRPAKIIAAGYVYVAAGGAAVSVTLPGTVPANVFFGGQFNYPGGNVTIPNTNESGWGSAPPDRRVQFYLSGNTLYIRERNGGAVYVSYYVVAEDGSGYTSGDSPVIYTNGAGGYMQLRRPGCSDTPNLSDILVDSRWQGMAMVANGYIPKASFGSLISTGALAGRRHASVSIPALGYKPLVLANWEVNHPIQFPVESTMRRTWESHMNFWWESTSFSGNPTVFTGESCYVAVYDGSLYFYNFFANPLGWTVIDHSPGYEYRPINAVGTNTYWDYFAGVRYYVFAIPQG